MRWLILYTYIFYFLKPNLDGRRRGAQKIQVHEENEFAWTLYECTTIP